MAYKRITPQQYNAAIEAADVRGLPALQAESVRYDAEHDVVVIALSPAVRVEVARSAVAEWAALSVDDMREVNLSALGDAVTAGSYDVQVDLAGLLMDLMPEGLFRTAFARRGGSRTSEAKAAAARANGALGGRPRKPLPPSSGHSIR